MAKSDVKKTKNENFIYGQNLCQNYHQLEKWLKICRQNWIEIGRYFNNSSDKNNNNK